MLPEETSLQPTGSITSKLVKTSYVSGGMIPKIEACVDAVSVVGSGHIIDGRISGALLACVQGKDIGTRII